MAASKKAAKAPAKTSRTLLVVESPSKARVISKYLGSKYKVIASVGHVRDLPKSRLGVDIDNNFEPEYINIRGKGDTIKEIKKEAAASSKVLLATDPDREGEAISWHLAHLLGIDPDTECRVMFNEINKHTVQEAIKDPHAIDMGLVDAQQARRVLDRLVGYQISPLLWKKVSWGLSAGRVQSAALKLICDREREILAFIPEEYWRIAADFGGGFVAELNKIGGRKAHVKTGEEADAIAEELDKGEYVVGSVKDGKRQTKPYAPFTTSSLQQDASIKLGFQTSKTMQIAQQLYEGINLKGIGPRGLVTYIRTDSVRVSAQAVAAASAYIKDKFGEEYVGNNYFANKNKAMQDAHEAIRPSDVTLEPDMIKDSLTADQYKLYDLIWKRFVASRMAAAKFDTMQVLINNGRYEFRANGAIMTFDGWRKVYKTGNTEGEVNIPKLTEGEVLELKQLIKEQKFTQPPARYTEASLVKEMEEKNIGRPSTYASIISVLVNRKYVKRVKKALEPTKLGFDVIGILQVYFSDIVDVKFTGEMEEKNIGRPSTYASIISVLVNRKYVKRVKKVLEPTKLGFDVTKILEEYFTDIVDVKFTGEMEDNLDSVEMREKDWKTVVADFYKGFSEDLKKADQEVERIEKEVVLSDEVCEICGKPMAIKEGRFGRFLACTGYPECKNTKPIVKSTGVKCPKCGKDIVEKKGRKTGKLFYGCSGYPECDVVFWDKPTGDICPDCGSMLVKSKGKSGTVKCSNPECKYKEKKK